MSKSAILSLVFTALVVLLVAFALRGVDGATCEVCITYKGRTECRTGQGRDRDAAVTKAQEAACAVLASGRDQNIQCTSVQPTSVSCD
jgi:hypothetical protein